MAAGAATARGAIAAMAAMARWEILRFMIDYRFRRLRVALTENRRWVDGAHLRKSIGLHESFSNRNLPYVKCPDFGTLFTSWSKVATLQIVCKSSSVAPPNGKPCGAFENWPARWRRTKTVSPQPGPTKETPVGERTSGPRQLPRPHRSGSELPSPPGDHRSCPACRCRCPRCQPRSPAEW